MSPQAGHHRTKVLVVEDEPDVREIMTELLEAEGYATEQAADGRKALALLRTEAEHPDLILLDLTMPVMSGWQFRAEQLADPELAPIPVVVMSAVDATGVDAFAKLQKPFELDVLVRTVEQLVDGQAAR